MKKIFAIIVIYNGMRNSWIKKCFDSIINSTIPVHIIAIDNNSYDSSVEFINENYPTICLIENKENKGFGGANNQGIEFALHKGAEYVFLLNQDAWVAPNTIEDLMRISTNNPDYGIVSPIHLNGNGSSLDYNFSNYITPNNCRSLYSDFVLNKIQNKIYESNFICAAAWLVTKSCLEKVGGFNPTFFHYAEDDNYVHRLKYKGLKIGVFPLTYIYHDREERDNSKYFNPDVLNERKMLLNYSDPNYSNDTKKTLTIIKNRILKYTLLLNFKEVKRLKKERNSIKKIKELTLHNLELSKKASRYIFLDYND